MLDSYGMKWTARAIGALAVGVMVGDMIQSAKFGWSISIDSMIIYGVISVASGLMLVGAMFYAMKGWKAIAYGLAIAWIPCFGFNIFSNMGVLTATRMGEVQQATLKQAAHGEKDKARREAEDRLKVFEEQLATLIAKNAWSVSVTADGLRQQVADLRVARESESKLGGCGPKCRGIENQITGIQGQIAIAERRENLDQQITATKRILADARTTVEQADAGISMTHNQSTLHAKFLNFITLNGWQATNKSDVTVANEGLGVFAAIVLAIASPALGLMQAWPKLMTVRPGQPLPPMPMPEPPKPKKARRSWLTGERIDDDDDQPPAVPARTAIPQVPGPASDLPRMFHGTAPLQPAIAEQSPSVTHTPAKQQSMVANHETGVVRAHEPQPMQVAVMHDGDAKAMVENIRAKIHAAVTGNPVHV